MTVRSDRQAREFAEMLAVPERTAPPPCPLCGERHVLEQRCALRHGGAPLMDPGLAAPPELLGASSAVGVTTSTSP